MVKLMALAALVTLLAGCTHTRDNDVASSLTVCLLALCETADRQERVGDDVAQDSTISESIDESSEIQQKEEGDLSAEVPLT